MLVKTRADNAKLARDVGDTVANALFAGDVVEVDPLSVLRHNDSLCAENHSEFARHKLVETVLDSREGKFICGLNAPACEYVVSVMMTVVMVVMVMTFTFGIVAFVIVFVVMMLVLVAITLMIVVMMMLVMMLMLMVVTFALGVITFVLVFVMMVTLTFGIVTFVIVMVMMTVIVMIMMLVHKLVQAFFKGILVLRGGKYRLTVDLIPRGSYYRRVLVYSADYLNAFLELVLADSVGARKHDSGRMLYLIAVKLRKVLHIHLALACVDHRAKSRNGKILTARVFDRPDNVGKLTYA